MTTSTTATVDGMEAEAQHSPTGIVRLISRVRSEVMDAMDRELAPYEISAAQLIVLSTIAAGEADSASALCKGISYDPGAMTRMIDRLAQKGLLRRRPHPEDRRTMNVELTPAGVELFPKLVAAKEAVVLRFFSGFNRKDMDSLERLLNRMLGNR